jgi:hypothetical protein
LERVGARDQAALTELMDIVRSRVFGWIRSILGAVDPQDAAQHVFLQLGQRTPAWAGCARFFAWLKKVAKNAAIDQRARDREYQRGELPPGISDNPRAEKSILLGEVISLLLRDVTDPHCTLCAVANKCLGDLPLEIESRRGQRMEDWLKEIAARLPVETRVWDTAEWNRHLLPLRAALRRPPASDAYSGPAGKSLGETCLNDFGLPADPKKAANMITKWVHSARRRLLKAAAVKARNERSNTGG